MSPLLFLFFCPPAAASSRYAHGTCSCCLLLLLALAGCLLLAYCFILCLPLLGLRLVSTSFEALVLCFRSVCQRQVTKGQDQV